MPDPVQASTYRRQGSSYQQKGKEDTSANLSPYGEVASLPVPPLRPSHAARLVVKVAGGRSSSGRVGQRVCLNQALLAARAADRNREFGFLRVEGGARTRETTFCSIAFIVVVPCSATRWGTESKMYSFALEDRARLCGVGWGVSDVYNPII